MNEQRYWTRLAATCVVGGALLFYLVLNLTVKGGKVDMPDLHGQGRGAAEFKLRSLGLKSVVREERFSNSPYGSVLEQDIEAGATIKRGRTVELILSKGTKIVAVPQLTGLVSPRQARLLLEQNGLEVSVEDSVADESPKDTVLAQSPQPGVEVPRGAAVSILYSSGPAKDGWVMPDMRGIDLTAARGLASRMGLILRHVTEKDMKTVAPGMVAMQSLSPGARVEDGMELNLVAATGTADGPMARLAAIEYSVPEDGVTERRVLIIVTDALGQHTIYNRMVKPGEEVKVEARVRGKASYKVTLSGVDVEEKEL